jgi:uncharacterized hydrophobic protein (TIGR00271 family)
MHEPRTDEVIRAVLQLRAYVPPEQAAAVGDRVAALPGVRHLVLGGRTAGGMVEVTGQVEADAADVVLDVLRGFELAGDDVTLWRTTSIQPPGWRARRPLASRDSAVWAEVMGRALEHARPALAYLLYMSAAGVVAGVGVLTASAILVVGAMALSPDLLPISAAAVAIVERRWALMVRAQVTLVIGLGVASIAAATTTLLLRVLGRIEEGLELVDTALGPSLTDIGPGSVLVALAAGVAGMLAYETAGSAAVGVAISVTTIPAAAYLGDAIGLGAGQDGIGAFTVLLVNVVCIEVASALTMWVQRRHRWAASVSTATRASGSPAAGPGITPT